MRRVTLMLPLFFCLLMWAGPGVANAGGRGGRSGGADSTAGQTQRAGGGSGPRGGRAGGAAAPRRCKPGCAKAPGPVKDATSGKLICCPKECCLGHCCGENPCKGKRKDLKCTREKCGPSETCKVGCPAAQEGTGPEAGQQTASEPPGGSGQGHGCGKGSEHKGKHHKGKCHGKRRGDEKCDAACQEKSCGGKPEDDDLLILRVPIFYQAQHLKDLLETYDTLEVPRDEDVENEAKAHQREVVQSHLRLRSDECPTKAASVRVVILRGDCETPKPKTEMCLPSATTPTGAPEEKDWRPPLSTGRAELIGTRRQVARVMEVIDRLDRPDPILDIDVLVYRIEGNAAAAAREYEKLILQVAQAQRIGESLNMVPTYSDLRDSVLPSLESFAGDEGSDSPITWSRTEQEFIVTPWRELADADAFRRRIELRTLLIGLAETKSTRDGQAKGQIIRRVVMQKPYVPSELVSAVYLTAGPTAYSWPPGGDWLQRGLPIKYDDTGRYLNAEEQLLAWIQYASMDDLIIAGALGLEWRYGKALDTLRYKLLDRAKRGRKRYEAQLDDLWGKLAEAKQTRNEYQFELSDKRGEAGDLRSKQDNASTEREKRQYRQQLTANRVRQKELQWKLDVHDQAIRDLESELRALSPVRLLEKLAEVEQQHVTGRNKPESINRILQLTQLQPRPDAGVPLPTAGRSMLFDESVLRLSSELTLQLRSGDRGRFNAGTITSELHEVGEAHMQKLSQALTPLPEEESKDYDKQRKALLDDLSYAVRAGAKVTVTETYDVGLMATAADLTSGHYYASGGVGEGPKGLEKEPSLAQSAFGSIAVDMDSTVGLSYELADATGTTPAAASITPIKGLAYRAVVDSTSYRPNLVMAVNFHRELTSRPGAVPYLWRAGGAWVVAGQANLTPWQGTLLLGAALATLRGQRTTTTQAIALVVTPRPRTALPSEEMLDVALEMLADEKKKEELRKRSRELATMFDAAIARFSRDLGRHPGELKELVVKPDWACDGKWKGPYLKLDKVPVDAVTGLPIDPLTEKADWVYDVVLNKVYSQTEYLQYWGSDPYLPFGR